MAGGVGSVLAFLPQVALIFLCLTILEECGYLARAAFLMDYFLRRIGLTGKSFIPLLMGFGCTTSAVMAARTLGSDRERLENGVAFPAVDRYLALIYPEMATAADYIPADAVVCLSESPRVAERARNYLWRLEEDCKSLLESGLLAGEAAVFTRSWEELTAGLAGWPLLYLDTFPTSSYPCRPRTLLDGMAKQLPSYGASLETACADLEHYQHAGFGTVVLCAGEQRCLNLQSLLREQKVRAAVDFQLHGLPEPGRAVLCVGGLTAGFEYPAARVAVLTGGVRPW